MIRDGLSLTIGACLTAAAGMLAWVVAARLLPREEVGQASAFVSGFLFVAGVGNLGLGAGLLRWIPRAGEHRTTLILRCYGAIVLGSCAAAAVVLVLPTGDEIMEAVPHLGVALFMFAALTWTLFQFQDSVLVAIGRARWVPYENTGIGLARVGIVVAVGPLLGTTGILLSWVGPAVVGVVVISILIRRVLRDSPVSPSGHTAPDRQAVLPDRHEVWRLLGPVYPAQVCAGMLVDLVPLLVIGRFGPAAGAVFFVVWMAGNTVDYATLSFTHSVIVRIAHEPERTRELFGVAVRKVAVLFVPALLLGVVVAGPVLAIFGSAYADLGTTLLQLVLLGCVPRLLTTLVVALSLAHGRGVTVAALEASSVVGVVGIVAVAPVGDLTVLGVGFAAVQLLVAVAAVFVVVRQFAGNHPRAGAPEGSAS
ncbi:MAG TPA: oligosaccharide flippase family protein [Pseudonocardiaceae bacterium]|jgi:O-antigen/teichoic acid export membrane protein